MGSQPPAPAAPPAAPPPPPGNGLLPSTPMKVGKLISLTWEFVVDRIRVLLAVSGIGLGLALGLGGLAVLALSGALPVDDRVLAILNGDAAGAGLDPNNPNAVVSDELARALGAAVAWVAVISGAVAVAQFWMTAAAARVFTELAADRRPPLAEILRRTNWLRLLGANLLASLVIVVAYLPAIAVLAAGANALTGLLSLAGFAGATVFVIWFAVGLLPMTGLVVAEGAPPLTAIRRSLQLARGGRGQMFGATLLVGLLVAIVNSTLGQVALLLPAAGVGALYGIAISSALTAAFATPFTTAVAVLIYINQRLKQQA